MNTGKVVIGVLAGFAAGALLGVLFAPDKGSETRKKISKKSSDTLEGLKDKFDDLLAAVGEKFGVAEDEAKDLLAKGKNKVEDFKNKAEDFKKDSKNAYS